MIGQEFEVWVCPECGSVYASQSTQGIDLTQEFNTDIKNIPTFARSRCPNHPDKEVHRVRCIAKVIRRWEIPNPPMTEAQYWDLVDQKQRGSIESPGNKDLPVRSSSPSTNA